MVVKGLTCYKDIKFISGKVLDSFKGTCFKIGFIEDDKEYVAAINEAKDWGFSHFMRKIFVTMILSSSINKLRHV